MKILRYIGYLLLGGLVGGIIGGILGNFDGFGIENLTFATYNNVVVISIVATIIIILVEAIVLMNQRRALKYKQLVDKEVDIDATDQYELLANRYVLNGSILIILQTVIAFLVLLIFVVGHAAANAILFFLIPFFASAIFNTQFTLFNRRFDDRIPKIADKNYTEKRLEILDEGERHIELIALFKTYAINLSILILAIVVIGLYSITTGINQSFSLLLIIAIFIYNAFSYLLKRRRFY
ncbi:TPA: DUF3169 family protein [Staphylococcus aureus]|nr:DUF3169 family protein [Staphylococcus aureus]